MLVELSRAGIAVGATLVLCQPMRSRARAVWLAQPPVTVVIDKTELLKYHKKDADRKKKSRLSVNAIQLKALRKSGKIATRKWQVDYKLTEVDYSTSDF